MIRTPENPDANRTQISVTINPVTLNALELLQKKLYIPSRGQAVDFIILSHPLVVQYLISGEVPTYPTIKGKKV